MTSPDEQQVQKFLKVFTSSKATAVYVQELMGVVETRLRPAAVAAILRIPELAAELCKGAVYATKPEEFALSLELLHALTHDEQRSVLTWVIARFQQGSGEIANSAVVQSALKSVRDDKRIEETMRGHSLLLRFIRP